MDEKSLKKFRNSFIIFWIGQICLFLSLLYFDGRFKWLPNWLVFFAIFGIIGIILMAIGLFRFRKVNHDFFLALITFIIFGAVTILRSVCLTSTDEFYINWAKGLDWSMQVLKCITYFYFFLGCYRHFVSLGYEGIGKKSKIAAVIFLSLFILERLAVFLLFFDGIRGNIVANRVLTFGQIIINLSIFAYVAIILTIIFINMVKKRREARINEEAK